MKIKKVWLICLVLISLVGLVSPASAKVTIITPTNNQTVFVGDTNNIVWVPRDGNASTVSIYLRDRTTSAMKEIGMRVPNTGTFRWVVDKGQTTNTSFQLIINDGGAGSSHTTVMVTIPNSPRPRPLEPVSVPLKIDRVGRIEWASVPGHTYRVESGFDLKTWTIERERAATGEVESFDFTPRLPYQFFRVYDMTPDGP